jgi:hypothetical protein
MIYSIVTRSFTTKPGIFGTRCKAPTALCNYGPFAFHGFKHDPIGENPMSSLSNTKLIHLTANIATFLFAVVIILQILLADGILPISMAWGGRQSELTVPLRIASLIAAVLLGVFMVVIRFRAGLVGKIPIPVVIKVVSWIITAFMAFNTLGNITSLSINEKLLFGPITFILTVACLLVSASKPNSSRPIHTVQ